MPQIQDPRATAMILASLRLAQRIIEDRGELPAGFQDIATDSDMFAALTPTEIDALCVAVNSQ